MSDSDVKEREQASGEHDDLGTHPEHREAENAELEKLFNNSPDDDEIPYNEEGPKRRGLRSFISKKKAASGGIGAVVIGLIAGTLTISQGTGQVIHAAQILSRFHFTSDSSFMDGRTGKLIKHIRTRNDPSRRNLGHLGNIGADHFKTKLEAAGIEQTYSNKTGVKGRLESLTIDPNTSAGRQALAELNANGFDTSMHGPGKVTVQVDGVSQAKTKGVITTITRSAGMDGVPGFMSKRLLRKRAGYISMFHPFKRLAAKGDEKFANWLDEFKKSKKKVREKGVQSPADFTPPPDVNGNPAAASDTAAANDAGGAVRAARSDLQGLVPKEKVSIDFKAKIGKIAGFIGIATVFCGIDKLGDDLPKLKQANLVLPLIRTGMNIVTIGSQIQFGNSTFSLDELRAASDDLYKTAAESGDPANDPFVNTSFFSDASIQTELGQPVTGIDSMANRKPSTENPAVFKVVDKIVTKLGGKRACRALTSTIGGYVGDAVDIGLGVFTGGGSAALAVAGVAAGYAGSAFFMDDLVAWLTGSAINVIAQGSELGGIANYGVALAARDASASHGGIDLSRAQSAALDEDRIHNEKLEMQHKSLFARYFDIKDSQSLASRTLFENQTVASLARPSSTFTNMMAKTNIFSVASSVFSSLTPKAHAATQYDYGFAKKGFTLEEINDPAYDDPYAIADEVEPELDELNEKYGKCFNMTVDPSTGVLTSGDDVVHIDGQDPICTNRSNTELTKYRFYLADKTAQRSLECFEDLDKDSCSEVGFGNITNTPPPPPITPTGQNTIDYANIGKSSDTIPCAPGTNLLGAVTTLYNSSKLKSQPDPIKINLCQVPGISGFGNNTTGAQISGGITVNSRVSAAWQGIAAKAKADKVSLSADSSFRLADSCGGGGNGILCAKPGASMHQLGIAVDFAMTHQTGDYSSRDCSKRNTMKGNPMWDWLDQNAPAFGIKQYSYENWHWDAWVDVSRCANGPSTPAAGGGTAPAPAGAAPSGTVQDMAKQILANPNITYPYDPFSANGSSKAVLQALASGQAAPVTCRDSTYPGTPTATINPKILQFVIESAQQTKVGINALTDKCHSSSRSNHYIGKAIDLQVGTGDLNVYNAVAAKYGGKKNSETSHHHYDFL